VIYVEIVHFHVCELWWRPDRTPPVEPPVSPVIS
jgi:hypothetical protein